MIKTKLALLQNVNALYFKRNNSIKSIWAIIVTLAIIIGTMVPVNSRADTADGVVTVIPSSDVDSFDPHTWLSGVSNMVGDHIFEALVTRDKEPLLATSWENPDKLTWIFHLKKGVKFTNGESFNADAVKFNFERIKDPKTNSGFMSQLKPIKSMEVIDDLTIKITTETPYPILIDTLPELSMMSPRAVQEFGKDIVRRPIGTGKFVLREWIPMEKVVLDVNPSYHGTPAKLKTIIWRPVIEPASRIVELKSGRADLIEKIPPELVAQASAPGVKAIEIQTLFRMLVMLNSGEPPFDNVKVRQALNYAVDKDSLIKYVLRGSGVPMGDLIGPSLDGHDPNLKPYPYDPAKAKQLLAEAGFPNGVEAEILCPVGRYLKDKETMEALAFQVKESGFNLKVTPLEWGLFLKNFRSKNGFFIGDQTPNVYRMLSRNFDSRVKAYSWFGYHDDSVLQMLDGAMQNFEIKQRAEIYRKIAKKVYDDAVYLFLFYGQEIYGMNEHLKDAKILPVGEINLHNAWVSK